MAERAIKDKARAFEEILGTGAWRELIGTLRDIEVGVMREAFEAGAEADLSYYRGMREGIITILTALNTIAAQATELHELEEDEEREGDPDGLGIIFGGGNLS
jgi:hypothetical protein